MFLSFWAHPDSIARNRISIRANSMLSTSLRYSILKYRTCVDYMNKPGCLEMEPAAIKTGDLASSIQKEILRGIDNGLDAFGDNVRTIFYSDMEKNYHFSRDEIAAHSEEFVGAISRFFTVGSSLVERS